MSFASIFPFEIVGSGDNLSLSFAVEQHRNLLPEQILRGSTAFFGEELDQIATLIDEKNGMKICINILEND